MFLSQCGSHLLGRGVCPRRLVWHGIARMLSSTHPVGCSDEGVTKTSWGDETLQNMLASAGLMVKPVRLCPGAELLCHLFLSIQGRTAPDLQSATVSAI